MYLLIYLHCSVNSVTSISVTKFSFTQISVSCANPCFTVPHCTATAAVFFPALCSVLQISFQQMPFLRTDLIRYQSQADAVMLFPCWPCLIKTTDTEKHCMSTSNTSMRGKHGGSRLAYATSVTLMCIKQIQSNAFNPSY